MTTAPLTLHLQRRTNLKKATHHLREAEIVPGIIYGKHLPENILVQVPRKELLLAYQRSGDSTLVDVQIDQDKPIQTIIKALDRDAISDLINHVDFYAVSMTDAIQTEVELEFTGVAPAVKELLGVLIKNKATIKIKCLPQYLIKTLKVDISTLKTFEDAIYIKDLALPANIETVDATDDIVATVTPPRSDEELAALNEGVTEDVSKVAGVVKATDTAKTDKDKAEKSNKTKD